MDAVMPPTMVATVLRAPWLTACETQSNAEGPGEAITAAAKDTYKSQRFKDISVTRQISAQHGRRAVNQHSQRFYGDAMHPVPKAQTALF